MTSQESESVKILCTAGLAEFEVSEEIAEMIADGRSSYLCRICPEMGCPANQNMYLNKCGIPKYLMQCWDCLFNSGHQDE